MDFGGIFDFGGEAAGDQPMSTPAENGGFFGWLLNSDDPAAGAAGYAGGGALAAAAAEAAEAATKRVKQSFVHKSLGDFFEGDDLLGQDLITYDAPEGGGWWPDIALTPTGKKWGLILLAAGVGFWWVRR